MCEKSVYFYQDIAEYDEDALKKHLRPVVLVPLEALYQRFEAMKDWAPDALQACINDVCVEFDVGMGKVAQPLRVAVTGASQSPAIDMTLTLLGKQRVLERLNVGLEYVRKRMEA